MRNSARALAVGALGYALGSIPSAAIATRMAGSRVDLTTGGSGNPGAFNAAAVLGRRWGILVGAADIGKGLLAGVAGRRFGGDTGCYLAATTAVAGHCYPIGRRGGKGAATSLGACLSAFPVYAPADLAVGAAMLALRRHAPRGARAAPAALASTAVFVGASALWSWRRWPNPGGPPSGPRLLGYALATSALTTPRWLQHS